MNLKAEVGSPDYLDMVDFVNKTMVDTFTEWRTAVRAVKPEVFFSIKSSRFPLFESPHIDTRLLAMSDTSGTEFSKPFGGNLSILRTIPDAARPGFDDQVAVGWSIVRDGAGGRPPLMWVPHLRSERNALYSAAAAITYGCVPQMNVSLREDLDKEGQVARERFCAVFELGKKVSPYLAFRRPYGWAGLHISANSRNKRLASRTRMWNELFAPASGAYQALKETHTPWVTLHDDHLAGSIPEEMKLIILPWPDELTKKQQENVAAFEGRGGKVIRMAENKGWGLAKEKAVLLKALKEDVQGAGRPPIHINGLDDTHAVYFRHPDSGEFTVCLSNTWGWFRSTKEPNAQLNNGTPPPPCQGVSIQVDAPLNATSGFEAVTQRKLPASPRKTGVRIDVPDFQIMACVALQP